MPDRPTVLVTGVGAIIGYGIISSLRQSTLPVRIIGMDIYDDAYGRCLADRFVRTLPAADPGYVSFVQHMVARERVDLIIPGIEQDLYTLWTAGPQIPVTVVMNSDLCLKLSRSKLDTFQYFNERKCDFVIPTLTASSYVDCVARLGLPFVVKPSASYGSKGMAVVRSAQEFDQHTATIGVGRCIYQKLIGADDQEYTISVFGDGQGRYRDSIILRRTLSRDGRTQQAWFVPEDAVLRESVDSICGLVKPIGPTNLQFRKDGGRAFLLEINPRISSACSIRTQMGYNEPEMCVRHYLRHEAIEPARKRPGRVVRFIADHFVEE